LFAVWRVLRTHSGRERYVETFGGPRGKLEIQYSQILMRDVKKGGVFCCCCCCRRRHLQMSATQIEECSPVLKINQTEDTYTTSKIVADPTIEWTPAYFNPPLAAERNGWVLNQLRRYSIRTVSLFFLHQTFVIYAFNSVHIPCDIPVI
jgi:hypothetical protein